MRLIVSGGIHLLTDTDARIEEIDRELQELDVAFIEDREEKTSTIEKILNWIWNPLVLTALTSWLVSFSVLSRVMTSDQEIIRELESEDVDCVPVDKSIHTIIAEQRKTWGAANWSMILLPVILVISSPSQIMIIFSVVLLIVSAIGLMLAFLAGTNSERNIHMVLKMREFAKENEIDQACLIVGKHHKSGIMDFCKEFDNIEIVD